MEVSEYECGIRKDESEKKSDAYKIATDSGYDSICNDYGSVLLEKSFSKESFDIFSPNSPNQTPSKQSKALKYHISTPKSNVSVKRHFCSSQSSICNTSKRIKSDNDENKYKTVNASINTSDYGNLQPLKAKDNIDFTPQSFLFINTSVQSFQRTINDESIDCNHSMQSKCRSQREQVLVPERPSKSQRYFKPSVIHSKRKLEIVPVNKRISRTYCNGARYLNIICRLEPFPTILNDIFNKLNSKDLLNMSLVSKNWSRIVKSNAKANTRIQQYLNESHNFKENLKEPVKQTISNVERFPFGQSNLITNSSCQSNTSSVNNSFYENQSVVQHLFKNERLVKCPRCNKGSRVSDSAEKLKPTETTRVPALFDSLCATSTAQDLDCSGIFRKSKSTEEEPLRFGVCTSLSCKYMFCLKCLCSYHPGENCKISEPESPSKLIISKVKSKLKSKSSCKLSSKRQSLRRLCFS